VVSPVRPRRHWTLPGGDAVSSEYKPRIEFTGGRIVKVVFGVADDAYIDIEQHFAAAMARD
jgi:hypothetical protein